MMLTTTNLYRIHRDGDLGYVWIKAGSAEDAAEKFAAILGAEIIDTEYAIYGTQADRITLANGQRYCVCETTLKSITGCHPVLTREQDEELIPDGARIRLPARSEYSARPEPKT